MTSAPEAPLRRPGAEAARSSAEVAAVALILSCVAPTAILAVNLVPPPLRRLVGWAAAHVGHSDRRVERAVTIQRDPGDVYAFWRDLRNLPRFMRHLERVDVLDDHRSHWVARAPSGTVEWDVEIVSDEPGREIAWRSTPDSSVPHEGRVSFVAASGRRGTEVHVQLTYRPPARGLGVMLARVIGEEPGQQVSDGLRRLKQLLECDEVVRADERVSGGKPAAEQGDDDAEEAAGERRGSMKARSPTSPPWEP